MAYRNGTYVAFDGGGELNPADSDRKYYNTLLMWRENKNIDFNFINSHEKTYQVRDTSSQDTLFQRLRERLNNSKNMILIVTQDTKDNQRGVLEYEIEYAIDSCKIPILIAYPEVKYIIQNPSELSNKWPSFLAKILRSANAHAIHIPFEKNILQGAINQFNMDNYPLGGGSGYYSKDAYKAYGCTFS